MILRKSKMASKHILSISLVTTLVTLAVAQSSSTNQRSFETNEWIPLVGNGHNNDQTRPQKTGRVLTPPASYQKNFFPGQQSFRETVFPAQQNQFPPQRAQRVQQPLQQVITQNQQPILNPPPPIQQNAALVPSSPDNLTPQFLPHPEGANFNGNARFVQQYVDPNIQAQFIQPQYVQENQQHLLQPVNDFQLLQQVIHNPNEQLVQNVLISNQTQYQPQNSQKVQENIAQVNGGQPQQKEEVQLVYVPLESLRQRNNQIKDQKEEATEKSYGVFTDRPFSQNYFQPDLNNQAQLQHSIQQDFANQRLQSQKLQQQLRNNYETLLTTIKPAASSVSPIKKKPKLKPHQPPLAVFMGTRDHNEVEINDVLTVLKDAKSISVLDQVTPESPQVFVGPSNLNPPGGYTKFDLPYLSSIHSRSQRKVEQLPFFVAPLSYKAPHGYAKIPFPPPHVGSVVVSQPKEPLHDKQYQNGFENPQKTPSVQIQTSQFAQNQFVQNIPQFPQTTAAPFKGHFITNSGYEQQEYQTQRPILTTTQKVTVTEQPRQVQNSQYDFTNYRTNPTGLNDEISSVRQQYSNQNQEQFVQNNEYVKPAEEIQTIPPQINQHVSVLPTQVTRQQNAGFVQGNVYSRPQINNQQAPQIPEQQVYNNRPIQQSKDNFAQSQNTQSNYQFNNVQRQRVPTTTTTERIVQQYQPVQNINPTYNQQQQQQSYVVPSTTENAQFVNQQIYNNFENQEQQNVQYLHSTTTENAIQYSNIPRQQNAYIQETINEDPRVQNQNTQEYVPEVKPVHTKPTASVRPKNHRGKQYRPEVVDNGNYQTEQEYSLPAELPPISPNLPGLINSLQDQALAAQLSSSEQPEPPQTYEPTTQTPVTSSRRPVSRTRQRNSSRVPNSTTPTTRGGNARRRRPYNVRPRQEYEKYNERPSTYRSTQQQHSEESVVDITTARPLIRHRYNYQREPEVEEVTKNYNPTRRFRTRDRSTTAKQVPSTIAPEIQQYQQEISTDKINNFPENSFQQPALESGFEVSSDFVQDSYNQPTQTPAAVYKPKIVETFSISSGQHQNRNNENYTPRQQNFDRSKFDVPPGQYLEETIQNTPSTTEYTTVQTNQQVYQQPQVNNYEEQRVPVAQVQEQENYRPQSTQAPLKTSTYDQYLVEVTPNPVNRQKSRKQQEYQVPVTQRPKITQNYEQQNIEVTPQMNQNQQQYIKQQLPENYEQQYEVEVTPSTIHETQTNANLREENYVQTKITQPQQQHQSQQKHQSINRQQQQINQQQQQITQQQEQITQQQQQITEQRHQINQHQPQEVPQQQYTKQAQNYDQYQQVDVTSSPVYETQTTPNIRQQEYTRYVEPQREIIPSTQRPRTRARIRSRTRNHQTTTTEASTRRPVTEKIVKENEEGEFYGFLSKPNYNKPEIPYKEMVRQKYEPEPVQQFNPTEESVPVTEDRYFVDTSAENVQQFSSSQTTPKIEEITQTTSEISTRRPYNSNFLNKGVRPTRPTAAAIPTTARTSNLRYTVRPIRKQEVDNPKPTRIRGRLRRPTKPTTTEESHIVSATQPTYAGRRPFSGTQTVNELIDSDLEEIVSTPKPTRFRSRGRSHYKRPENLKPKSEENDSLEGENYPAAFLQYREAKTQRPEFKITVGPEDDNDQLPYSSIYRPRVVSQNTEQETAESQWSKKYTSTAFRKANNNFIPPEEKDESYENMSATDRSMEVGITETIEQEVTEKPVKEKTFFEMIVDEMEKFENQGTSTESTSTKNPEKRGKKRGVWRKVKVRPVDNLETAESQHITSSANELISESAKKLYSKHTPEKYIITFPQHSTESSDPLFTILNLNKDIVPTEDKENITSMEQEFGMKKDIKKHSHVVPKTEAILDTKLEEITEDFLQVTTNQPEPESDTEKVDKMLNTELLKEEQQILKIETQTAEPSYEVESETELLKSGEEFESLKEQVDEEFDTLKSFLSSVVDSELEQDVTTTSPTTQKEDEDLNVTTQEPQEFITTELPEEVTTEVRTTTTTTQQPPQNITTQSEEPQEDPDKLRMYTELKESMEDHTESDIFDSSSWESLIIGTSTSTEISHETEICYRGRCVKSNSTEEIGSNNNNDSSKLP